MKTIFPFKPLKKARLYEEVAEQIKDAIFRGQFEPGDRLPAERELCDLFNVGRPTIREALRTLSVMGLVEVRRGSRGCVVKELNLTKYLDAMREQLSWLIRTDRNTLKELWEVRRYIEWGIARSVAERATKKDFKKLDELMGKMEASREDFETYFQLGTEFHRQLALVTGNKIFFMVWEMFHDILLKGYLPILRELFPEGISKLLEANKILLKAIKSGDSDAIDHAMVIHAEEERFFNKTPAGEG